MAAKRSATTELNHENWNQDEEPENAGEFQRATNETLKRRIIKTARRRNPISSVRSGDPEKKSAFIGFTGFSNTSLPTTSAFSFLSTINQTEKSEANGTSQITDIIEKDNLSPAVISSNKFSNIKETNGISSNYFSKLKGLNESVTNWIKKHVDNNPLINLQPIFKDYEKYFKELENEDPKLLTETKNTDSTKNEKLCVLSNFVFKVAENVPDSTTGKAQLELDKTITNKGPNLSCGPSLSSNPIENKDPLKVSNTTTSATFSFGRNTSASTMRTLTPSFSFGSNVSTSSSSGFNFSSSAPFTIGSGVQSTSLKETNKEDNTEEEDEPPQVKFTPVVEKHYIFTTKCKVFVKKPDGNYGDRGVGNLYLKQIENSNKVQLIVRADTNLGNLLCNFILSKCIPTKRMGKKDIMLVCLPTPDVKPPPVPILLRVKSPEEADNLLKVLEKHKK